jgi:signal transduction histidine kinase
MRKQKWMYSVWSKLLCWAVLVSMACLTLLLAVGINFIQNYSFSSATLAEAEKQVLYAEAGGWEDVSSVLNFVSGGDLKNAAAISEQKNITFRVTDAAGTVLYDNHKTLNNPITFEYHGSTAATQKQGTTVTAYVDTAFPYQDQYAWWDQLTRLLYGMKNAIYGYAVCAFILGFLAFLELVSAAGRRPQDEEIHTGPLHAIPGDLYVLGVLGCMALIANITSSMVPGGSRNVIAALYSEEIIFAIEGSLLTVCILNIAVRVKAGGFWKHTVLWWILKNIAAVIGRMGIVPKTVWILLGAFALDAFSIVLYSRSGYAVFWFFKSAALFCLGLWIAEMLKSLQLATAAMAAGNLGYQVDTDHLKGEFRTAGENLNHIAQGMSAAVDERMKSERMKTELITNVSHDIKTPLTSIINYTDLIAKEPSDNAQIQEYAQVLTRQSVRLKKLIEDLIEASKASTGNLDVLLAPCEANVFLTQAAGEYEQKMKDLGLELVMSQPDHPVRILADGRRMWRIFDNLLNNICKYSQHGTRVYLDLSEADGQAVLSFKNTSREPLNISADELKERFVRGDSSRNTEGNGLGLSIAESLTELQKGTLELNVDGDLFKVTLRFPQIADHLPAKKSAAPVLRETQALNRTWTGRQAELQKNWSGYHKGMYIIGIVLFLLILYLMFGI